MNGVQAVNYVEYTHGVREQINASVIDEALACISVNGSELATMMCSPFKLDELALGWLRAEGFVQAIGEVRQLHIAENNCVDVWLQHPIVKPERGIITAGCGGGITFDDLSQRHEPLDSAIQVTPAQVCAAMKTLMLNATIYNAVRGIHTSALCADGRLLHLAEDVGRHNTIDRLWGKALLNNTPTRDAMLVCSGRISSEMLSKAMKMQVPVVISRTSPTSLSVALARAWNITVIGYCRGQQFRVYAGEQRIVSEPTLAQEPG